MLFNTFTPAGDIGFQSKNPCFSAAMRVNQTGLAQGSTVLLAFDSVDWASPNVYNPVTYRFTPNIAGIYLIMAGLQFLTGTDTDAFAISLQKNGATFRSFNSRETFTSNMSVTALAMIPLNGITDYVTAHGFHNFSGNRDVVSGTMTFFQGVLIS